MLGNLVERGAFAQLDAASLTGNFGHEIQQVAKRIVQAGLAHFIATDAHHQNRRRPVLSRAAAIAAEWGGEEYACALVEANPEALVNNQTIPFQPEPDVDSLLGRRKIKSWFAFWK